VDDEDEVRGRIPSKISEDSGFTVVGTTGNGYDALELIEKHSPQVVLTDIKMPYIDGIELAAIIRRDFPTVRVGFITGYNEFDYAREAIRHNVRSYLTKPLTQEDIASFLRHLKVELDEEYRDRYNRELIEKRYEQSVPLIIENFFINYLVAGSAGLTEDLENLKEYGVSLDHERYVAAYVRMERTAGDGRIMEHEKLKFSLRANLDSILERETLDHYSFLFNEGIVFLIKESGLLFKRNLDNVLYQLVKTSEHFLQLRITIGVSTFHKGFPEMGIAYEEAAQAASLSRLRGEGPIIYIDQITQGARRSIIMGEADSKTLEHAVRFGKSEDVRSTLAELRSKALANTSEGTDFHLYVLNLVNLLANYAASLDADIHQLIGEDILEFMIKFRSLDELFSWADGFIGLLREAGEKSKMNNAQRLLEKAAALIEQRYGDCNLTMEAVCDELGLSVSYLSHLFKRYKETTFVKYLTSRRIEKAKELLAGTGDRIVEVANICGYRDVYYFSHSFKKYTGLPPRTFREHNS
jgi:two-component system response regulator YesN